MKVDDLILRVRDLLSLGESVLATKYAIDGFSNYVDSGTIKGFRAASLSFIELVYGINHTYYKEFSTNVGSYYISDAEIGISILKAIESEIAGGWLFTLKGLIAAEFFADFVDMAEHLLEENYKDPSAVMVGSVLEEHLRQLCQRNSISIEEKKGEKIVSKKADSMNSDLAKACVYSKLDQKQITAWLDLRNKAAHGRYMDYNHEQVKMMLNGVREFIIRCPIN